MQQGQPSGAQAPAAAAAGAQAMDAEEAEEEYRVVDDLEGQEGGWVGGGCGAVRCGAGP